MSPGTVSNLNEKALESIDGWRNRPLACEYRYVYVDGVYLKRAWGGAFKNKEAGASEARLKKDGPVRGDSPGRKEGMCDVLASLLLCKGNKQWSGRRGTFIRHLGV